jgi:hypothetical protein
MTELEEYQMALDYWKNEAERLREALLIAQQWMPEEPITYSGRQDVELVKSALDRVRGEYDKEV